MTNTCGIITQAVWAANMPSRQDDLRRAAKASAISSLQMLSTAFDGDDAVQHRITSMLLVIEELDVKPPAAAVGMVVIGDAVESADPRAGMGAQAPSSHQPVPSQDGPSSCGLQDQAEYVDARAAEARMSKRPRRTPREAQQRQLLLEDFPPNETEVLMPRRDYDGRRWNEYCRVIGHRTGQLLIDVPDEDPYALSLHSIGIHLGEESRPPWRAVASASACAASSSASPMPALAAEPAPTAALPLAPAATLAPPRATSHDSAEAQLAASQLRRSKSCTREQLNDHLTSLGLIAKFGVPVVSKKDDVVSHLTFNIGEWNDLPASEQTLFEWWLGEGDGRLRNATLLNPEEAAQPPRGTAVFFAVKRKVGGALCFYGGHFTTHTFRRLSKAERFNFKGRDRQAKIELMFHHFDDQLCAAVDAIAQSAQSE